MRRLMRGLAIATVLLGGASLTGGVLASAHRKSLASSQPVAPAVVVTDSDLARLGQSRVFFAHMSVGFNVLTGMTGVYADRTGSRLTVVDLPVGEPLRHPSTTPVVISTEIGKNGDPLGKLHNFDTMLRSGLAEQVDVALIKFCYVDVGPSTDVGALFAAYRSTLDALERDFPQVVFLHSTVPLTVGPRSLKDHAKVLLGRDANAYRQQYNTLVRQTYGPDRLFDLAAVESTDPSGRPSAVLYDGYSSDGEHLNERGGELAAKNLIRLLADRRSV